MVDFIQFVSSAVGEMPAPLFPFCTLSLAYFQGIGCADFFLPRSVFFFFTFLHCMVTYDHQTLSIYHIMWNKTTKLLFYCSCRDCSAIALAHIASRKSRWWAGSFPINATFLLMSLFCSHFTRASSVCQEQRMQGTLWKWTNYFSGISLNYAQTSKYIIL